MNPRSDPVAARRGPLGKWLDLTMPRALLRRWRPASRPPPRLPDGVRVYAIGDIHGRSDLLQLLRRRILADAVQHPHQRRVVIYLGDYIDRGPDSPAVLEQLSMRPLPLVSSIHLMGNHEQSLLRFLDDPERGAGWLQYGGLATLAAYGLDAGDSPPRLAQALRARLPARHRAFLERLQPYREIGDYLFVHAGIRPDVPLADQHSDDLLWIREPFLSHARPHPWHVVHGHQVYERPDQRGNRTGIDTGAFATGCLTCLVLQGSGRWFIDTRSTVPPDVTLESIYHV